MEGSSPITGMAAGPPAPQTRPEATPLSAGTTTPVIASPATPWPRSAQWATAALLIFALGLLGWNAWNAQSWTTRPTELDRDADAVGRIDLNHADRAQLLQLPGVGDITAAHIEEYRQSHHGFQSVDDLRQIHGIGPALVERLRPLVRVEPSETVEDDTEATPPVARPKAIVRNDPPPKDDKAPARKPAAVVKKGDGLAAPVDVNHATGPELQRLPGIGPAMSSRILQVREQQPFRSVDELRRVPGIGVKTLDHLRPFVTVGDDPSQPMP
jgi:competence protein ComEA